MDAAFFELLDEEESKPFRVHEARGDYVAALDALAYNPARALAVQQWWTDGMLTSDELGVVLHNAWAAPRQPLHGLSLDQWLALFESAGYLAWDSTRGVEISRPSEPVELFRGAEISTNGIGMSWTEDLSLARKFASEADQRDTPGGVFRVVAPPDAVLAIYVDRFESEVVVHPGRVTNVQLLERVDRATTLERRQRHARVFGGDPDDY